MNSVGKHWLGKDKEVVPYKKGWKFGRLPLALSHGGFHWLELNFNTFLQRAAIVVFFPFSSLANLVILTKQKYITVY